MRRVLLIAILALTVLLSSCYSVRVGRILSDPARYQGRMVHLNGVVTSSVGAFVAGAYRVDDGTGTITVLSNGGVPRRGTRVSLDGRVQSGVSFFGQSYGTTIRERNRRVHY